MKSIGKGMWYERSLATVMTSSRDWFLVPSRIPPLPVIKRYSARYWSKIRLYNERGHDVFLVACAVFFTSLNDIAAAGFGK